MTGNKQVGGVLCGSRTRGNSEGASLVMAITEESKKQMIQEFRELSPEDRVECWEVLLILEKYKVIDPPCSPYLPTE